MKSNSLHIPIQNDKFDTVENGVYITAERMESFQYTNAYRANRFVAIYAQQTNHTKFVDFEGLAAGVSLDVYALTIVICWLLYLLFVLIDYMKPSNEFNRWNIAIAISPFFNWHVDY
jgi:hypothetical protein